MYKYPNYFSSSTFTCTISLSLTATMPASQSSQYFSSASSLEIASISLMAAIAVVVYEKLGVMILKRTWFNLDLLWAGALVAAGVITLVVW